MKGFYKSPISPELMEIVALFMKQSYFPLKINVSLHIYWKKLILVKYPANNTRVFTSFTPVKTGGKLVKNWCCVKVRLRGWQHD